MTPLTRVLSLALAVFLLPATAVAVPPPVVLKPKVTVNSPQVRLGDIFLNVGALAEKAVTAAPEPGESVVFDARALQRLARGYAINWRPEKASDAVVVERAGVVLDHGTIEQRILDALSERGLDPAGLAVSVPEQTPPVVLAPAANLTVERLSYRPPARRFAAILAASIDGRVVRRINVGGEISRSAVVPVLQRGAKRGDTIVASDVGYVEFDESRLPGSTILVSDEIVGMAARHNLRPGVPIQINDLTRAVVVEKDSLVMMTLSQPGMHLTARGRALQDGGLGEVISVVNLQSKLKVEGVVTGPGAVAVGPQASAK